jgi:hypothetical protein
VTAWRVKEYPDLVCHNACFDKFIDNFDSTYPLIGVSVLGISGLLLYFIAKESITENIVLWGAFLITAYLLLFMGELIGEILFELWIVPRWKAASVQ